jgi:cysteinyl-tRNA synthetase
MASVWMHNGFLQVEGRKMAKSEGNFVTIRELLRDWPGDVLRLAMLMTHYREPIDWTLSRMQEARSKRIRWLGPDKMRGVPEKGNVSADFVSALSDDLNTIEAFSILDEMAARARSPGESNSQEITNDLAATMFWLGIANDRDFAVSRAESEDLRDEIRSAMLRVDKEFIRERIAARNAARTARHFAEADHIRDELAAMGVELHDTKDGTTWEVKR